ncbi:MAG: hypothetical protein AAFP26_07705 [Planctomycetota bacterium]
MKASELPLFRDPAPELVCSQIKSSTDGWRVPVRHLLGEPPSEEARSVASSVLRNLSPSHDLRQFYEHHDHAKLFVGGPPHPEGPGQEQYEYGAIYFASPAEWLEIRKEWEDWFFDGAEAEFEDSALVWPHVMPFARRNWSPDLWYIVVDGPEAGRIGSWDHDCDGLVDPRFDSLSEFLEWLSLNIEDAFGGVNRYSCEAAREQIAAVAADDTLFPLGYEGGSRK